MSKKYVVLNYDPTHKYIFVRHDNLCGCHAIVYLFEDKEIYEFADNIELLCK